MFFFENLAKWVRFFFHLNKVSFYIKRPIAAPKNVDDGFIKATSNNLPVMTIQMVAEHFSRTPMFINNESSGDHYKANMVMRRLTGYRLKNPRVFVQ